MGCANKNVLGRKERCSVSIENKRLRLEQHGVFLIYGAV